MATGMLIYLKRGINEKEQKERNKFPNSKSTLVALKQLAVTTPLFSYFYKVALSPKVKRLNGELEFLFKTPLSSHIGIATSQ